MFAIIGVVVVIASIIGGYLFEQGPLHVLWQPAEVIIIGGAAIGIVMISNPPSVLKALGGAVPKVFMGKNIGKAVYQDVLSALYEVFFLAKKDGLLGLEDTVNSPEKSQIFGRHQTFLAQKHALHFLCDSLKLMVDGSSKPSDLEAAMDAEIETLHEAHHLPVHALARVADALPGMGIVAAVMGVVIAVQGIDGPPAEIGHKIGAALVGTFLGILLSYGFVGPMSTCLEHAAQEEERLLQVIKTAVIAFCGGAPPAVAVDLARRNIFPEARPSSTELNAAIKSVKQAEAA